MIVYLNGKACEAFPSEQVLQVALRNHIYEKTGKAAKCRACVVEVEGQPGLKTSCNLPVVDGMRVHTNSQQVLEAQKLVVDLVLSSGRHDCLSCEQNGNCELQDAAYYLGIERPSFQLYDEEYEIDDSSEFIRVDRSKCISCGRCIAGCNQTVVNEVLTFANRGVGTKIAFDTDLALGSSSCVQCGECVQLCPVGCLIDKRAIGRGRTWELDTTETVCPYCGVGCRLEVHVDRQQKKIVIL
jgi:formate dehydrogenase major subunit